MQLDIPLKDDALHRFDPLRYIPWLETKVFNNTLHEYILTLLGFFVIWWLLNFLRTLGLKRLSSVAEGEHSRTLKFLNQLLGKIKPFSIAMLAFYLATRRLELLPSVDRTISFLTLAVVTVQIVVLLAELITFLVRNSGVYQETDAVAENTARNLMVLIRVALWAGAVLFLLDNAGVNISAFVAGLGISGVAIALAAQAILGDTFSSFAIALDKPFQVGDFIVVDALAGTVEHIGLKTTRVRSVNGELLIFANSDLTKSRIQNFKRMFNRRVTFKIGADYTTPIETLTKIGGMIKDIVESTPKTRFERAHFKTFADKSLEFEVVYYVLSPEYNVYMDIQQAINFKVLESFQKHKINIPTAK